MNKVISKKRIGWFGAIIGVGTSLIGILFSGITCSLFCVAGLLITALGIGTVGFLYKYGSIFIGIGILLIGFGMFLILRPKKIACGCKLPSSNDDLKNNVIETELIQNDKENSKDMLNVVIISAACCVSGMAAFDEQAQRVIGKAISETGIIAKITIVPATSIMFGGAYRKIMNDMIQMNNKGKIVAPVILINKEVISYGVPNLEDMKKALIKFTENKSKKEK